MQIGIISDTHGYIDDTICENLAGSDEIWHAGDIGNAEVIAQLGKIAKVRAVYGNIDDRKIIQTFPEDEIFQISGLTVFMTHIAAKPPKYVTRVRKIIESENPDLLICGHSHILKVQKDPTRDLLYINPGAAGQQGFHKIRTMLKIELGEGKILNMNVVELGKRGRPTGR